MTPSSCEPVTKLLSFPEPEAGAGADAGSVVEETGAAASVADSGAAAAGGAADAGAASDAGAGAAAGAAAGSGAEAGDGFAAFGCDAIDNRKRHVSNNAVRRSCRP